MARDTLQAGGLRLTFDPELGGAITSLAHDGRNLLRPTPDDATEVLETACFPLVPYANRIAGGRFSFGGRTAALSRNMAGQTHPLHGDGWRGAWQVEAKGADVAAQVFEPTASEWPWRYRARQTFRLRPDDLTIALEVTNLDDTPGPFGVGVHPYFPHSATARLTARTRGFWRASADLLPTEHVVAAPWAEGPMVRGEHLVDHCHTGWSGPARIDLGPGRPSLELSASPSLGWLHVFAPPGEAFFCVEPVSHAPNALNMSDPVANGVSVLEPGQSLSAGVRLKIM